MKKKTAKKAAKQNAKSPISKGIGIIPYKFKKTKHVGYYNPEDLKPKKEHYSTKLKRERDDFERKLFLLYRIWKGENPSAAATANLLTWLRENERVNHMAISRSTVSVTSQPSKSDVI